MTLFALEMKKIWKRPSMLVVLAMVLLAFASFVLSGIASNGSFSGMYGGYQEEMFIRYGDTLEQEEYADFDFPGKLAALYGEAQAIIDGEPLFAQYGITTVADFRAFDPFDEALFVDFAFDPPDEPEPTLSFIETQSSTGTQQINMDYAEMMHLLYGVVMITNDINAITIEGFDGVMPRILHLEALVNRYGHLADGANPVALRLEYEQSEIVRRQTERYLTEYNANLIGYTVVSHASVCAALLCIVAVLAVVLTTAPMLVADRAQNMHSIQYTSHKGRKIIRTQLAAILLSAALLGIAILGAGFLAYLYMTGNGVYWHAHIAHYISMFDMYNLTFGQYVWILGGMSLLLCLAAGGFSFLLSRFSANIVALMIKAVPAAAALSFAAFLCLYLLFNNTNILFTDILRGQVEFPELILCGTVFFAGMGLAAIIVQREKRVDVA